MKKSLKLLIFIILFTTSVVFVKAETYNDLEVKWQIESSNIDYIEKNNNSFTFYNDRDIIKVSKYSKDKKELNLHSDYTIQKNGNYKDVFYRPNNKTKMIKIDDDLNIKEEHEIEIYNIIYYKNENNNKFIFYGSDPNKNNTLIRLELDKDFKKIKKDSFTFNKYWFELGYDKNNIYYFKTEGTGTNTTYVKYQNGFVEIDANDVPSNKENVRFRSYFNYNFEYDTLYNDIISEGEDYNKIDVKNPVNSEYKNTLIFKDGTNFITLFSDRDYHTIQNSNPQKIKIETSYLKYYDSSIKEKWSIEIPGETIEDSICGAPRAYTTINKYKNNIALAYNRSNIQSLQLIDKNGKSIKDLSPLITKKTNYYPIYINTIDNGLLVAYNSRPILCSQSNKSINKIYPTFMVAPATNDSLIYFIDHKYNIETKINGKGSISVQKVADANDLVKFTVKPEKGYVLSVVKVTDADGNMVYFTDYTFTMPSADVTIEAIFVPEGDASAAAEEPKDNPKTGAYIPYMIFTGAVLIGTGILIIDNKRKNKISKI